MASQELQPSDIHHLRAAVGWLELGNPSEAGEDIARISSGGLDHPSVLKVRWHICAASQSWEAAVPVATHLVELCPGEADNWIHRAYSLRRARGHGLSEAWDALMPAVKLFPEEPIIAFNLACYAAQLGRQDEAIDWLRKAMSLSGKPNSIKTMALADKDLESIWDRVRAL